MSVEEWTVTASIRPEENAAAKVPRGGWGSTFQAGRPVGEAVTSTSSGALPSDGWRRAKTPPPGVVPVARSLAPGGTANGAESVAGWAEVESQPATSNVRLVGFWARRSTATPVAVGTRRRTETVAPVRLGETGNGTALVPPPATSKRPMTPGRRHAVPTSGSPSGATAVAVRRSTPQRVP